ncbi:TPA: phage baseplate protein [Enterobacter asburiae]|nr:phage baseplate protein [Enterobacter asburiae]HCR2018631.1 phage baseplate protein [Enterobacter asburiae]HCR2024913.1 phage baseplate protein [Enterobacter asburiae]HCR2035218.1 phage baseplate protein [Enterobacter asburiae]HCR2039292.1 phage baseplate protein [Enterobacter asburiae]
MADHLFTPTSAQTSDAENLSYVFKKLLSGAFFIELVEVTAIRGAAPNLVVDVIPLVTRTDPSGATIQNSEIFNVPVFRLQRGMSAVIMNPVPGDIGMIAICDRDNSIARANRKQSVPGSKRMHSKSDALYLGGFLNQAPTQYVEFADNKINIVAPYGVNITTPDMYVSGNVRAGGDITDNVGTQSASLKTLRDKYDQHKHQVPGVQTGGSTVTSNTTDKPA